ncbi:LppA family lipoprotein [Nocardia sp. NPDC058176]|uniref:LppA family lipoprotein n=1 Tax=Nocardia sp. NPDC058176 TaxID=3346368 RepID=UPI0036DC58FF
MEVLVLTVVLGVAAFIALWVVAILLWGWAARDSGYESQIISPEDAAKADAELRTRSSLEDAEARGEQLVERLRGVAGELVPGFQFRPPEASSITHCDGPFSITDGRKVDGRDYRGNSPFPEDQWAALRDQSLAAAGELGIELVVSEPAANRIQFETPDGDLRILLKTNRTAQSADVTYLILDIGCHLPAAALSSSVEPTR